MLMFFKMSFDADGNYLRELLEPKVITCKFTSERPDDYTGVLVSVESDNYVHWFKNGMEHREFRPAALFRTGCVWYLLGIQYSSSNWQPNSEPIVEYWEKLYSMYRDSDPEKARLAMAKILGAK